MLSRVHNLTVENQDRLENLSSSSTVDAISVVPLSTFIVSDHKIMIIITVTESDC